MPPVALLAALGVLAVMAARRAADSSAHAGAEGCAEPVRSPDAYRPSPRASLGLQTLNAAEKVSLFADMGRRLVIEAGMIGDAESLLFADPKDVAPGDKAAPALDVLYGANMGAGGRPRLAILLGKAEGGKTIILADGRDWASKTHPGSFWNLFLSPGEAALVARAARVTPPNLALSAPVAPRQLTAASHLPTPSAHSGKVAPPAPSFTSPPGPATPPVLRRLIESGSDLGAILLPPAGFVSNVAERAATLPALDLPSPVAIIRDNYKKANALYIDNDVQSARAFAPILTPAVRPLRDAGYALASAQIQTLLAKIGVAVDV